MKRGDVFWADLAPRSHSEQSGRRPVIVMSHDAFNHNPAWMSIIVVPISTSDLQAKRVATAVPLPKGTAGLAQASIAVCHQVTTLDRGKIRKRVGELPSDFLALVENGLRAAMHLSARTLQ